ncbi:hypothetical protein GCM10011506_00120 [Marivirga lumbricoides]|uniref:PepSY domain-containing protein n=2 Tax=Marivirga lumbricoides TaxID=1046115 RepID=A0ABQ1L8V9_9BACT|nr:hypothetical protein GCM10011506_00120 [Marivirga lumbricoides]
MDSIPFKIPSHKNNINTSLIMPASVQRTFEASGFQVKSIIDAKEVNSTQGKVYEFILYEDDSKWLLKYNENGKLLDSNKLSEANNLDQLLP